MHLTRFLDYLQLHNKPLQNGDAKPVTIYDLTPLQRVRDHLRWRAPAAASQGCSGSGLAAQSCLPLDTPWTVARQATGPLEFPRQEYWRGLPFPSPGDLPDLGIQPGSPALQADSLPTELGGEPLQ